MADTERLNQPTPPSDLTQRSDADIADWLRTVAFWASTVIGSPKSVKGVAVAYIEEAMRRLGREQAPASDADIATWQERHGLEGLSATDARACFEDAATLHMTMPLTAPARPGRNDFLAGALAMRGAAAKAVENSVKCCENFSLEYVEHIPVAQSCCGNTVTDRPDQIAETIRAIDPASLTEQHVAPVVDAAMVQRAIDTFGLPPSFNAMRRALEAALKGER